MTTKKIILLNGPPGCGKDTLGRLLQGRVDFYKMSQPLKDGISGMFGIPFSVLEATKDEPRDELFGQTFRQMQISMSEDWLKECFGNDVFGVIAVQRMSAPGRSMGKVRRTIVVTDAGFQEEQQVVVDAFGRQHVVCLKIHREKYTYDGDSRHWLDCHALGIDEFDIYNDGEEVTMLHQFDRLNSQERFLL